MGVTFTIQNVAEIADDYENSRGNWNHDREAWSGNITGREALTFLREGKPDMVARSNALLAKIEDFAPMTTGWTVVRSVTGGAPVVPAYLSGHPLSMRRRGKTVSERAPLAILMNVSAYRAVKPAVLERRGAACLALVRALAGVRPVRLYAVASYDDHGLDSARVVEIETAPLDLARAAFVLGHPGMLRKVILSVEANLRGRHSGQLGGSPLWVHDEYAQPVADALGVEEYIAQPRISSNTPFKTDEGAVAWVTEHLVQQGIAA